MNRVPAKKKRPRTFVLGLNVSSRQVQRTDLLNELSLIQGVETYLHQLGSVVFVVPAVDDEICDVEYPGFVQLLVDAENLQSLNPESEVQGIND